MVGGHHHNVPHLCVPRRERPSLLRKPAVLLPALALALGLAACGSDDGGAAEPTSVATTTPAAAPTPVEPAVEETTPVDAGPVLADAPDPGPAPEGEVLPSGSLDDPPSTVAGLTRDEDRGGLGGWYRDAAGERTVSVNADNYVRELEDYAAGLGDDAAPGGTGICGTNSSGSSIMCYQQTEDGLSFISGDPEEVTVEDMVVFVNDLADQIGTV